MTIKEELESKSKFGNFVEYDKELQTATISPNIKLVSLSDALASIDKIVKEINKEIKDNNNIFQIDREYSHEGYEWYDGYQSALTKLKSKIQKEHNL